MGRIRLETTWDQGPIAQVLTQAFGRRAESELVDRLRDSDDAIPQLCLVAEQASVVVGHVFYSRARVDGVAVAALAPIAVTPAFQGKGVGTALMNESLARADAREVPLVVLVGYPEYYSRFGFVPADSLGLQCPWDDVPADAFMAKPLSKYQDHITGLVRYPDAFDEITEDQPG